ncbi:hemogen-like [Protopterus annectens]|uniref:hemogen-like n=1 Tax=Protopterus annectens TaxID=7888 RepID=UPI001CFC4436|nr:hemogen-like [Protopterus annectens]
MEHHEKEHTYSDVPHHQEMTKVKEAADEPRRLRDRDQLKKRRAEAEQKESYQEMHKSKRQRKGRTGGKRGGKSHHKEGEEDEPEEEVVEKEPEVSQQAPSSGHEPKNVEAETFLISDDDSSGDIVKKDDPHDPPETTPDAASSVPKVIALGYPQQTGNTDDFSFPEEDVEEPAYHFYSSLD